MRIFDPRSIGPDISSRLFVTALEAAVVIVALDESVTVPERLAVRLEVLNEPRIAPCVPLASRPSPPIVKLLDRDEAFRSATDPLPLTITEPVPKA